MDTWIRTTGEWRYRTYTDSGDVYLICFIGSAEDVVVSAQIDGKPVTDFLGFTSVAETVIDPNSTVKRISRMHAGGWNVRILNKNADVNAVGAVDLKDVILIRRFLAGGWNVTLV